MLRDNDLSDGIGKAIANNDPSAVVDASGNWWGDGVDPASRVTGSVDYTPWLNTGTDAGTIADGFQGDFSSLTVSDASVQVGDTGRIQEGVDRATAGGTVNVLAGTYVDNMTISKSLHLLGAGELATTCIRRFPPPAMTMPPLAAAS